MKQVAIDSSVLVSALVKGDKHRHVARQVMEKIFRGEYKATASAIVFVEVCGAISRRAGMQNAIVARDQLVKWRDIGLITYNELTAKRTREAAELAIRLSLKGMDAIVVQLATEKGIPLITLDEEIAERAKSVVEASARRDTN